MAAVRLTKEAFLCRFPGRTFVPSHLKTGKGNDVNTSEKTPNGVLAGIIFLVGKLGAKLSTVMVKCVKVLKVGKVALFGASFAAYAHLWTWKFAVIFMASLFIHEMGHVWAMRRYKVPHGGINFIPFLGAVIVPEKAFPSYEAEAVIGIMGPVWGGLLAVAAFGIYRLTGSPLVAALAGWMAMLNVFNLLPIMPLDGGRVMHSAVSSLGRGLVRTLLFPSLVLGIIIAYRLDLTLLYILVPLGFFEARHMLIDEDDIRARDRLREMMKEVGVTRLAREVVAFADQNLSCSRSRMNVIFRFAKFGTQFSDLEDVRTHLGKHEVEKVIPPRMSVRGSLAVLASFIVLIVLLLAILFATRHVPGADIALKVFQDS